MQASILLEKPPYIKFLIYYRELRNLLYIELDFIILYNVSITNLSLDSLNGWFSSSLNSLDSIKSHYFNLHPSSLWFSSQLSHFKRSLRKLEPRYTSLPYIN